MEFHSIKVCRQLRISQNSEIRKILIGKNQIFILRWICLPVLQILLLAWTRQFRVKFSVAPSLYDWTHLVNALKRTISSLIRCSNGNPGLYLRRPYKIFLSEGTEWWLGSIQMKKKWNIITAVLWVCNWFCGSGRSFHLWPTLVYQCDWLYVVSQ